MLRSATLLITSALVAACASYPKPVGPPGPDGGSLTWEQMDERQRKRHMEAAVVPVAADVFGKWRPEKYKEIECSLCHGPSVRDGDFTMPTEHLPRLSGDMNLGTERENHRETTKLKLDELVPKMADALGVKSFSVFSRTGFGCYSCHLGPDGAMFGN